MNGGFQTQAYNQPVQAFAGDFASSNPFFTYDAGPGGLVAGALGVIVGRFAWVNPPDDPNGTNTQVANSGAGQVAGFVPREQQGLNSTYLSDAGVIIAQGFQMTLMTGGDFWCVNDGSATAQVGQKAFANNLTGKVSFAAAGSVPGGASATGSDIAAGTFSVTGSLADDVLTVTAVGSGTVYPGATISGTGIATGTKIASQVLPLLSGEAAGGIGRYLTNVGGQVAASTTVSGTYGILTIGTATGTFTVGATLTGTNVVAGTAITANISGSGGTGGTMVVNNNTVVASTTITASASIETKWYATSAALAGNLVKISDHPPG